jgi:HEXXH motif-containing protein
MVADLLSGPQVGAWAARCLRRLAGPGSPTPLWIHLAQLGSIAAVAAVRSGLDTTVRVPVRSGVVTLPTLGRARVDTAGPWALAECTPSDPVLLDGSPPRCWQPVRLIRTDAMSIPLDDLDPYWNCFGLTIGSRLDDTEIERWQHQLDAAWTVLAERHRDWLETVAAAVRCLVPVESAGAIGGVSASSGDAPGAVALTEPTTPERLAATLVHEVQHFRLAALHDLVPLYNPQPAELLYSPFRNDPRRLPGLLHGIFAFLGVADFWSREWPMVGRGAELMYAKTVRQLRLGRRILTSTTGITPAGRVLASALGAVIDRLPETGLDPEICRLADDLVAHHRALWRMRNVVPDPVEVARLTSGWRIGHAITVPAGPTDRVTSVASPSGDSPLFRLATAWVEDPDLVRAAAGDRELFESHHPGADSADVLLLAGRYAEAQAGRIADGAPDDGAWASLSVAHGRRCADPTRSPLATRPELVRAALSQAGMVGGTRNSLAELASRYEG